MPLSHILHTTYSSIQDYRDARTFVSLTPFEKESDEPSYKTSNLSDIIEFLSYENTIGKRFVDSFVIELPEKVNVTYLGPYFMKDFKQSEHLAESVFFFGQVFHPSISQDKCERHKKNVGEKSNKLISAKLGDVEFKNILHIPGDNRYSFVVFGLVLGINGVLKDIYHVRLSLTFAFSEYLYCLCKNTLELIKYKQDNAERVEFSPERLGNEFNLALSLSYRAASEMSRNNYEELIHYDGIPAYHVFYLDAISIPEKLGRMISFSHSKYSSDFMVVGLKPKDYIGPENNLLSHEPTIHVSSII